MVKKYIRIGIAILMSLLAISTYTLYTNNQKLKEEISISVSNQKAFIAENSSYKAKTDAELKRQQIKKNQVQLQANDKKI